MARLFVDENDLALGKALAISHPGDVLFPGHPDLPQVPRGTIDDEWLPVVGVKNLVVVTRDQRIRYRPVEKRMWLDHGVRGFVLTGRRSQSTTDSLHMVEKHWLHVHALMASRPTGPWMYALTEGQLREIELAP